MAKDALVICTRNRPDELAMCFTSLVECESLPSEIIVVDSSDAPHSARVEETVNAHSEIASVVSLLRTKPGLTHQRNEGLKAVSIENEIVHFIDDDSLPLPGYFSEIQAAFADNASAVGIGGAVVPCDTMGLPINRSRERNSYRRLRSLVKRGFQLDPRPGHINRAAVGIPLSAADIEPRGPEFIEVSYLSGCAMSFRMPAARDTGFNEEYLCGYSLGEDLEFCLRISRHGVLLIAPRAGMRHMTTPTNRLNSVRLMQMNLVNRHHFVKEFPERFSFSSYAVSVGGLLLGAMWRRDRESLTGIGSGLLQIVRAGHSAR